MKAFQRFLTYISKVSLDSQIVQNLFRKWPAVFRANCAKVPQRPDVSYWLRKRTAGDSTRKPERPIDAQKWIVLKANVDTKAHSIHCGRVPTICMIRRSSWKPISPKTQGGGLLSPASCGWGLGGDLSLFSCCWVPSPGQSSSTRFWLESSTWV